MAIFNESDEEAVVFKPRSTSTIEEGWNVAKFEDYEVKRNEVGFEGAIVDKITLRFSVGDADCYRTFTYKTNPESYLYQFVEAMHGGVIDRAIGLEELKGKLYEIFIEHNTKGDRTYVNIAKVRSAVDKSQGKK